MPNWGGNEGCKMRLSDIEGQDLLRAEMEKLRGENLSATTERERGEKLINNI